MLPHLEEIVKLYDTIMQKLRNQSLFETNSAASRGYERLHQYNGLAIGLSAANSPDCSPEFYLVANSPTTSLASLHVADRRGYKDYEPRITPEAYAQFCAKTFDLSDADARLLAAYLGCREKHGATLNGRLERALTLASDGSIKRSGSDWLVSSQSDNGQYNVSKLTGSWQCTCQDHAAPALDGHKACKHICAVWLVIKAGLAEPAELTQYRNGAEAKQARCSRCGQNWRRCGCAGGPGGAGQTVEEQRREARESLNLPKNQPKHRPAYQFTGHKYGWR